MSEGIAALAGTCANCGAPLQGRFCSACGQEAKPLDPPVRHFAKEFAQEFFDVDGKQIRSLRRLVFSPGFLTREYVEGRRVGWLTPLKLYLLTSVAAFAMFAIAGSDAGLKVDIQTSAQDETGFRALGYANGTELAAAISAARDTWLPRVMFVLVPIFGWLVSIVRRGAHRRYPSHLVFALHVHAAWFAVRAISTAVELLLPRAAEPWLDLVVFVYTFGYLVLAFVGAYGGTRLRALRDSLLVGIVYWIVLLAGAGAVVILAVLGRPLLHHLGL
jgi:uncharacterized protein DUF3667